MRVEKYKQWVLLAICGIISFPSTACSANPWNQRTSRELVDNAEDFDKKNVTYTGEVIGDIMRRGDYAWLNVQDKFGTISVWAPGEMAALIFHQGSYAYTGDAIEVTGKFFRADPNLGGELYIRADGLRIVARGHKNRYFLNPLKVKTSLMFLSLAVLLLTIQSIIRKRVQRQ